MIIADKDHSASAGIYHHTPENTTQWLICWGYACRLYALITRLTVVPGLTKSVLALLGQNLNRFRTTVIYLHIG